MTIDIGTERKAPGKGWWNPEPTRQNTRFHYVGDDNRALCGKWHFLRGTLHEEDGPSPDDCKACRRKLTKLIGSKP